MKGKRFRVSNVESLLLSLCMFAFLLLLPRCDSPTGPETVKDGLRAGEVFWFVERNHLDLAESYRFPGYAYVTVFDYSAFTDTSNVVIFVSAAGDTEHVQLHLISVGGIASYLNPGGASVYLNQLLGQTSHDGVLYVGGLASTISATYMHYESGNTIQISASIKP